MFPFLHANIVANERILTANSLREVQYFPALSTLTAPLSRHSILSYPARHPRNRVVISRSGTHPTQRYAEAIIFSNIPTNDISSRVPRELSGGSVRNICYECEC